MGIDFKDDTHAAVIMLKGTGPKTERKIPL